MNYAEYKHLVEISTHLSPEDKNSLILDVENLDEEKRTGYLKIISQAFARKKQDSIIVETVMGATYGFFEEKLKEAQTKADKNTCVVVEKKSLEEDELRSEELLKNL
jgi:hypothetical protein